MEIIIIPSVVAMLVLMLCRRKKYNIPLLKTFLIVAFLAIFGVLSTCLLYFIENGEWGGKSFFGAVLFVPIIFLPLTKIFKLPFSDMMDFVSLSGLLMFAVMKANCTFSGCCGGRVLWYSAAGKAIHFPSPIVETLTTLLLVCVLLYFEHIGKMRKRLYPVSLVSYGALRFVLNFFRLPEKPFVFGLQKGNFWSIVAIFFGLVWIFILAYIDLNKKYKEIKSV